MLHIHHAEAPTSSSKEDNVATSAISPQASTPRVLNELARHEMRQSKVILYEDGKEKVILRNA